MAKMRRGWGWRTLGPLAVLALTLAVACRPSQADFSVDGSPPPDELQPHRVYIVLLIADGWGYKQIEAARSFTGLSAVYDSWPRYAMSTFDVTTRVLNRGVGYDPSRAWTDFDYLRNIATDSAAAATAMYCGEKTSNGNISVNRSDTAPLQPFAELAASEGVAIGAVTTVPVCHATPGAWVAHNDHRGNYYAIADELLWGDPNTTGTPASHSTYQGGWPSAPTVQLDVLIGGGHPSFTPVDFLNVPMHTKLFNESGMPGKWTFVERWAGSPDGGMRLLSAAANPGTERLMGLFGGGTGALEHRLADGSGTNAENPTLAEMATAALTVLERKPNGFALLVESGAVDWGGHANDMNVVLGEITAFDEAAQAVVDWVDNPANGSDWSNTLVIVTGDHETGLLSAGLGEFPDLPLGLVDPTTLALEQPVVNVPGRRASWDDLDGDGEIDTGETVYWAWNTGGHSNTLIPLHARGLRADGLAEEARDTDNVRGPYLDNISVFTTMRDALYARP